ncbi:hypothetical protein J7I98_36800, partial [Streptomyces sp. ISL-98]|uniref:hypothetical protein n=1 Tax=Streptomyces sp. ISL-98 TaxID=2819192 RepID=UPI001C153286|nr:hypothetical protein [Streptomyces sp. ISL-98]
MTHPLTEALRERIMQLGRTGDPDAVVGEEAGAAAARLVAYAQSSGWTGEILHTLGWFHWYRSLILRDSSGPDFRAAIEFFRPLMDQIPDELPDPVRQYLLQGAHDPTPADVQEVLEEGLRRHNTASELLRTYQQNGDPALLDQAASLLHESVALLRRAGAAPEMVQITLVKLLLMRHRRGGEPQVMEEALALADGIVEGLTSAPQSRTAALLANLGASLVNAHPDSRDARLLSGGILALRHAHEAGPEARLAEEIRFRLTGALFIASAYSGDIAQAVEAATYVDRMVAEDGGDGGGAQRVRRMETCASFYRSLGIRALEPALLPSRTGLLRALVRELSNDDHRRTEHLTELGMCLRVQHRDTRDRAALAEAVDVLREVLAATEETDPDAPARMVSLSNALLAHVRSGEAGPLEEGVALARRALAIAPGEVITLSCLGNTLLEKYRLTYDIEAAEESARLNRAAADATPPDNPGRLTSLMNAALSFRAVGDAKGDAEAVDLAIDTLRMAERSVDAGHPSRAAVLVDLGEALITRGGLTGDLASLREGRELLESVTAELPDGHDEFIRARVRLVHAYRIHHEQTGEQESLDAALRISRSYVDRTDLGRVERSLLLAQTSLALAFMYKVTADRQLLSELLPMCRAAVEAADEGSPAHADALLNLGMGLVWIYEASLDKGALQEGIDVLEKASSYPPEWPTARSALSSQADARRLRISQSRHDMDTARRMSQEVPGLFDTKIEEYERELDAMVDTSRRALAAYPQGDPNRGVALCNLGLALDARAGFTGNADDIEEAASLLRQAVGREPGNHDERPLWMLHLAFVLQRLSEKRDAPELLTEAVELGRAAVTATRPAEPNHPRAQVALGSALMARQQLENGDGNGAGGPEGGGGDSAEAIACFLRAARAENFDVPNRITSARRSATAAVDDGDWETAAGSYEEAVALLPRLAGRQIGRSDREEALAEHLLLASDGAACALNLDDPLRALRILEGGRGILLGQAAEVRQDLARLHQDAPELAQRFEQLSQGLDDAPSGGDGHGLRMDEHRSRVRAWERVCAEIREQPGFGSFLKPPVPDVGELSQNGPVVVVNLSRYRSDALVLADGDVTVVPLATLELQPAMDRCFAFLKATGELHSRGLGAEARWEAGQVILQALEWLWEAVAEPVLRSLGLTGGADEREEGDERGE